MAWVVRVVLQNEIELFTFETREDAVGSYALTNGWLLVEESRKCDGDQVVYPAHRILSMSVFQQE